MQIDLEKSPVRSTFQSTVCVVGAGIAGLLLARQLANSGVDVHLLEAGGLELEIRSQKLYNVQMGGRLHKGATEGRFRVFGGSSTRWGGQLLAFAPDIFVPAPGTPSGSWPVTATDVQGYYAELDKILHLPGRVPDEELLKLARLEPEEPGAEVDIRFSKWLPFSKRNMANTIGSECLNNKHVSVFLHANVTSIEANKITGRIERIVAKNYNGQCYEFFAKQFVICAGTIETNRLLLASRTPSECGLGNTHDQVGRYFHDHISVAAATVTGKARREFVRSFSPLLVKGILHTPKLEASPRLREEQKLLAVMGHFAIEEPDGSGVASVREFLQRWQQGEGAGQLPGFVANLPRTFAELAKMAWCTQVYKRRAISNRATITLRLDMEQLPAADRRIKLSADRDVLGMPRAIVDWNISEVEHRTAQVYARVAGRYLQRLGVSPLRWNSALWDPGEAWLEFTRDTYHAMGGTRMGTDPRKSVVNENLRVHGIPNLFVASCSVFPGGGSSNPTFTLMALALRLGDHLTKLSQAPAVTYRSDLTRPAEPVHASAHLSVGK